MLSPVPARKGASSRGTTRSARVTTRTGDGGDTSLFGKGRVRKTDPRIVALGDLDEAQSAIGVARAMVTKSTLGRQLLELQRGLYVAMSEVGTPESDRARLPQRIDATAIAELEEHAAAVRATVDIAARFVIPGEDELSARLDLARAVSRRAERRLTDVREERQVPFSSAPASRLSGKRMLGERVLGPSFPLLVVRHQGLGETCLT